MKTIELDDLPARHVLESVNELFDAAVAKLKNAASLPGKTDEVKAKKIEAQNFKATYDETKRVVDAVKTLRGKLNKAKAELDEFEAAFDKWRK